MDNLSERVLRGDRYAISRSITIIENEEEGHSDLIRNLYPHTGNAFVIGVTGPVGTGKSTLVDSLVRAYRKRQEKVAVVAIDPSSPISGGAILGDRVRMLDHSLDEQVYIRSMASKGNRGGLSRSTRDAVRILDAAGFDVIFIETVGIGQAEIEVSRVADCVIVVSMPESGDEVQAIKAGLMEVGDIFVVNKCDLPGSDMALRDIQSTLGTKEGWKQVALKVSAKATMGINELVDMVENYRISMNSQEFFSKRLEERLRDELVVNVVDQVSEWIREDLDNDKDLQDILVKLKSKQIDPDSAKRVVLEKYFRAGRARVIKRLRRG